MAYRHTQVSYVILASMSAAFGTILARSLGMGTALPSLVVMAVLRCAC